MSKERSPFSPGKPVAPELFTGRRDQVRLLDRAMRQAAHGNSQYLFITGDRGIGKSSLASLGLELAKREHGFVGAHALLGSADTVGEACRRLYEALVGQMSDKSLLDRARDVFRQHIRKVDLFGIGVEFKNDEQTRSDLAKNFVPLLARAQKAFAEAGSQGILLIADDINGVSADPKFARFFKSTVDQMAVGPMREFPWALILVGVPERMDDLKAQQPSVDRIFQPIELTLMDETAAQGFFERAFRSVEHTWDPEALASMRQVAGGFPVMWHELGDAVFWEDRDLFVSADDVTNGTAAAAENVGRKYLKRPLYDELRSSIYERIRDYIANSSLPIKRSAAAAELPPKEAGNFDNFIRKMRDLGVMQLVPGRRGQYEFTHLLYYFYLVLQSSAEMRRPPRRQMRDGS